MCGIVHSEGIRELLLIPFTLMQSPHVDSDFIVGCSLVSKSHGFVPHIQSDSKPEGVLGCGIEIFE